MDHNGRQTKENCSQYTMFSHTNFVYVIDGKTTKNKYFYNHFYDSREHN